LDATLNPAFRGLGYASLLAGRTESAQTAWERAIAIAPDDDFSTYNLGLICLERGDKPRAKRLFTKILDLRGADLPPADRDRLLALIEKCK
jgi:tetratricopeptide (TPR) repeat protein